ncbi:MAG: TM2 domain-containing protein [Bacilli bacterium]
MAKFCSECGCSLKEDTKFCPECGYQLKGEPQKNNESHVFTGQRNKWIAGLLGLIGGSIGAHNFYLGFYEKAITQIIVTIFTCGIGAIWGYIEAILILSGSIDRDVDGNTLSK